MTVRVSSVLAHSGDKRHLEDDGPALEEVRARRAEAPDA